MTDHDETGQRRRVLRTFLVAGALLLWAGLWPSGAIAQPAAPPDGPPTAEDDPSGDTVDGGEDDPSGDTEDADSTDEVEAERVEDELGDELEDDEGTRGDATEGSGTMVDEDLDAEEEEEDLSDPLDDAFEPAAMEDVWALEALEREMLDDLRLRGVAQWVVEGPYEGLDTDPALEDSMMGFAVREVEGTWPTGTEGGATSTRERGPVANEDAPPGTVEPLERFDLSGIGPLFGIDELDRDAIQVYLHFFTTRGRRRLARYLSRMGRYETMIRTRLREAGLPEELIYLSMIESGFDTTAVSRAGAVGLWQFMPRTGRARGLVVTRRYDERRDPERATEAAVLHLTRLYDRFHSWPLAMAAYNAGSGHVRGEIRRFSVNDFWSMDDYGAIYDDTRRYVHKIIAAAIIGENPERFGFEGIVREAPVAYDTVTVPGETSLRTFARAVDTEVDALLELNPSLRVARLPEVDAFELHIPAGSLPEFLEEVDGIDPDDAPTTLYRLRFGETVESLAAVLRIPERAIRHYNGLERRESVPYGTELVVPLDPTTVSDAIRASMGRRTSEEPPLVITPELEVRPPRAQRVFYQVQRGDLLDDVAAAFGVSVYQLAMWNDLDPEAALHSDMILQVWLRHDVDIATALADTRFLLEEEVNAMALGSPEFLAWREEQERERRSRRREYTVRRGDTVSEIARRFGVRPSDIVRWNRLDSANHIRTGQVLRIR